MLLFAGVLVGAGNMKASADPWLAPGDESLRSDIHLLADAGILHGPVTTWPTSRAMCSAKTSPVSMR
jgi:hypothetical protein